MSCQREVGSACSMAAGALAEVMGGSPHKVIHPMRDTGADMKDK